MSMVMPRFARRLLTHLGLYPHFTELDVSEAMTENILYDHGKSVEAMKAAAAKRHRTNEVLRNVLTDARIRSASKVAEVERMVAPISHSHRSQKSDHMRS